MTIDGVTRVIDSGLARIARHSPWSGIPSLEIEPVSRASCAQRAGRAGRTRPGRVMRLYTKHDHDTRRAFEVPEIARADLAGAALELHGAGLAGLGALRWFEPPPDAAARAAEELLARLGAIAARGGRGRVRRHRTCGDHRARAPDAAVPRPPAARRLLCEAEARGVAREACVIAALVGARELRIARRRPGAGATRRVALGSDRRSRRVPRRALRRPTCGPAAPRRARRRAPRSRRRPRGEAARADRRTPARDRPRRTRRRRSPAPARHPHRVPRSGGQAARTAIGPEIVFAGGGSGTLAPSSP